MLTQFSALMCVRGWFTSKAGAAFGLLATGSSLGGVLFPIMLTHLVKEVGFPWAMRTAAFIILLLLILANLTVKPRVLLKRGGDSPPVDHLHPFRDPSTICLLLGFFLLTFGIFVPIDYIVVQARAAGMGAHILDYLVPILNAARFVSP